MYNKFKLRLRVNQSYIKNISECFICLSLLFCFAEILFYIKYMKKKLIKVYKSFKLFERVQSCCREVYNRCNKLNVIKLNVLKVVKILYVFYVPILCTGITIFRQINDLVVKSICTNCYKTIESYSNDSRIEQSCIEQTFRNQLFNIIKTSRLFGFLPMLFLVTQHAVSINDKQYTRFDSLNISLPQKHLKFNKTYDNKMFIKNSYLPAKYRYGHMNHSWLYNPKQLIEKPHTYLYNPTLDKLQIQFVELKIQSSVEVYNTQITYIPVEILSYKIGRLVNTVTSSCTHKAEESFCFELSQRYSITQLNRIHNALINKISNRLYTQSKAHSSHRECIKFMYVFFPNLANYLYWYVSTCIKGHTIDPWFSSVSIIMWRSHQGIPTGKYYMFLFYRKLCYKYDFIKMMYIYVNLIVNMSSTMHAIVNISKLIRSLICNFNNGFSTYN